ncbi:MAG: FliH/SctL family protein [Pyrinomonadaceae bacterium]
MIIRVNALDLAIVEEHRSQLDTANRFASLEIVGDSVGVKRGGCLISTENGSIDAQLETQLQGIERALLEMRNNQTPVIPAATTTTALA